VLRPPLPLPLLWPSVGVPLAAGRRARFFFFEESSLQG
jgi:hypothetical protein